MSPAAFHVAILRIAAMLVPLSQRPDWLAEWRSELWHVRRDPHGRNVAAFCLGAFRDAFWLRRNGAAPVGQGILRIDVPPTPAGIDSFPDQGEPALTSPVQCLVFLAAIGALCFVIAFLLPASRLVLPGALYPRNIVMLTPAGHERDDAFGPYPSVSREQFELLKARDAAQFTELSFHVQSRGVQAEGFVVGRLRYDTLRDSRFHFIRLRDRSLELLLIPLPGFLVACFLVAVMTPGSSGGHLTTIGPRRGLFLIAKAVLVLPIIMFGSLDLASLGRSVSLVYLDVAFFGSFFAVRWIVSDQRQRCPVCLRLLANPVRIGESSRILLEWHGTELMCDRGHGLLYVPEWPAIWSGRQRWLDLGASWSGLFR